MVDDTLAPHGTTINATDASWHSHCARRHRLRWEPTNCGRRRNKTPAPSQQGRNNRDAHMISGRSRDLASWPPSRRSGPSFTTELRNRTNTHQHH